MVRSPELRLETTRGGLAPRVTQQVQALVYSLNQELQEAYIDANLDYVQLILEGGRRRLRRADVRRARPRGDRAAPRRAAGGAAARPDPRVRRHGAARARPDRRRAARDGEPDRARAGPRARPDLGALGAGAGVRARAGDDAPRAPPRAPARSPPSGTRTCSAGSRAGSPTLGQLVAAKVALAAVVTLVLGMAIALAFGVAVELGDVAGGEPWARLPLLAAGLALAGASVGALGALVGALAREARTASLVAVLVVLPIVFLGLVPREVAPVGGLDQRRASVRARGAAVRLGALRRRARGRRSPSRRRGSSRSASSSRARAARRRRWSRDASRTS